MAIPKHDQATPFTTRARLQTGRTLFGQQVGAGFYWKAQHGYKAEVKSGVNLKDPALWTLSTRYSQGRSHPPREGRCTRRAAIHRWCANTDGIDVDSSENVLVERDTTRSTSVKRR